MEAAIFAEGGRTLIASDDSGSVSMVDVATGRPIRPPLSVGERPADSLDLSPDGRLLAAASFDGSVFVWNAKTGEPYGSPLTVDTSPVSDVAFSPDGRTLVSAHLRSAVVWNMSGEQAIGEPLDGGIDLTTDVSFSPDGKRLVAGQFDGGRDRVRHGDATTGVCWIDVGSIVTAVAFAPRREARRRRNDRRPGSALRSDERGDRRLSARRGERGRLAGRVQPGRSAARGRRGPERRRERLLRPAAAGRGAALGRGLPESGGADDRAGRRIGARRGLQPGRHAAGDRQRRAARPVGRGHPGTSWQADEGLGRRRPERRLRSERPARRRRRCDRPGARLARGRSAPGLPAPHGPHRPDHRRGVRPGRLVPRDHEPCSAGPGSGIPATGLGYGDELVGSPMARLAGAVHRPSRSWGCGTRSARTASCWPSRESRRSGCCGTSIPRSGASARARSWAGT